MRNAFTSLLIFSFHVFIKQPENQKVGEWIQVSCKQKTSLFKDYHCNETDFF